MISNNFSISNSGTGLAEIMALRKQIMERSDTLQSLRTGGSDALFGASFGAPPKTGFADTLKSAVAGVSATQNRASELAAAYERGEVTDIAQVMVARQEASVAFEATLQVRNKLLSAYQDIMRMGA